MVSEMISHSPEETRAIAQAFASFLQPGDVLSLVGDLGAGKTTFTQGLALGLGISGRVNSPTFTLVKEYEGRLPLYHMDLYRLTGYEELGFDEYFYGTGVTVIEWPEVLGEELPQERLEISFTSDGEVRRLRFIPYGKQYEERIKEFMHDYARHRYQ
ncbi:MAG: tRNA (adenosine(37)-N6)-threonylcarbamoyltransferase complex ATPase subunit type 1 TsaE [Thermicanus sp.]|nr:tRNA (adenosine(37)-N6)-threonylcarbamoyltransferase complex ATPase subunit type 1 TsaE [Thermicanus sp.]